MINQETFNEMRSNLDTGLYTILEERDDNKEMDVLIVRDRDVVTVALTCDMQDDEDETTNKGHSLSISEFKDLNLGDLNRLINNIDYYG